jgi:hypothetical protein
MTIFAGISAYVCGALLILGENEFCYRFMNHSRIVRIGMIVLTVILFAAGIVALVLWPDENIKLLRFLVWLLILVPCAYGFAAAFCAPKERAR